MAARLIKRKEKNLHVHTIVREFGRVYMSQQVLANKQNRLRDLRLSLVRSSEYGRVEVCASRHDNEKK